jgi:hypothetical protein
MRIKDLYLNILELGVSKEYLQKRLDDYRNISALMFFWAHLLLQGYGNGIILQIQ